MSPFRSLLDELLKDAGPDEPARAAPGLSWDVLDAIVELQGAAGDGRAAPFPGTYAEPPEPVLPAMELPPADRDTIAGELGLRAGMTPEELGHVRRRFARHNHPDGLPGHLRDLATARMMMANMLIDEAEDAARRRAAVC